MKRPLFLFFLVILAFPLVVVSEEESLDLIYKKISDLEQEIATLRNLIEENTYLIERYQELHQQRYLDLDNRSHNLLSEEKEDLVTEYLNGQQYSSTEEIDLYKDALEFYGKNLGLTFISMGQKKDACKVWEKALSLGHKNAANWINQECL